MKFKKLTILFAAFLITANFAYTSYAKEVIAPTTNPEIATRLEDMTNETIMTMELCQTYYETLSDNDKDLYELIGKLVTHYAETSENPYLQTNYVFTEDYNQKLLDIAHMYLYDHPEYGVFWEGGLSIKNQTQIKLNITNTTDTMISDQFYADYLNSLNIEPVSDYYIAYRLFTILSGEIKYDFSQGTIDGVEKPHWNDDYAALLQKESCCQGISFAYKRLCEAANIPCVVITCYTETQTYHMLNAIFINGSWKFCDLTGSVCFPDNMEPYWQISKSDFPSVAHELRYIPTM